MTSLADKIRALGVDPSPDGPCVLINRNGTSEILRWDEKSLGRPKPTPEELAQAEAKYVPPAKKPSLEEKIAELALRVEALEEAQNAKDVGAEALPRMSRPRET